MRKLEASLLLRNVRRTGRNAKDESPALILPGIFRERASPLDTDDDIDALERELMSDLPIL